VAVSGPGAVVALADGAGSRSSGSGRPVAPAPVAAPLVPGSPGAPARQRCWIVAIWASRRAVSASYSASLAE
jgi:hypothetical protein